ncbi:DUF4118 domain-containing protein [Dactylosporangium roseum]|uniref:histidine kinase n=1 Tax=Dactylosporangium roseum TaxID=47989 RepID=A0ABY5YWH2_9ACTN|nr:DUF4118 domain-containing protein [Dactylosporangium roseum]UWZ33872.1 DUF4118 domain-containing protein [Dactylosporangium roseum]
MRARLMSLLLRPKPPLSLGLTTAAVLIAVETLVLIPLRAGVQEGTRSSVYLLGVLVISTVWGVRLGVLTAVASVFAFNYFHVPPYGALHLSLRRESQIAVAFVAAALLTGVLAQLARSRAVEVSERRREAGFAADLTHLILSAGDLRSALSAASRRLAQAFELPAAVIQLEATEGDERWTALPLSDGAMRLGTLLVPADLPQSVLARLRQRVVPSLESLLGSAYEREAITRSLAARREESKRLMAEQVALRRVATLVARGASLTKVFGVVVAEVCKAPGPCRSSLVRYEPDGTATRVAGRSEAGLDLPIGMSVPLGGDTITGAVLRTGRPARMTCASATGAGAALLRETGMRSAVGVPVMVQDRLWGVVTVASSEPIPAGAETRLADFADLVASAVANTESRAQLTASRARIVAAADDARRRLERDLHDGAQQRLVSLGLELRTVDASLPPDLGVARQRLSRAIDELTGVLQDLREISRGIHPALLSEGGLGPAVGVLARRSAIPVALNLDIGRRLPEKVEVAAYYVVSEALTNAAKHARARMVHVDAEAGESLLLLSIRDDGVGGADVGKGSGLIGLQDRIETLGGHFEIVSPPGSGTTLVAKIPFDAV